MPLRLHSVPLTRLAKKFIKLTLRHAHCWCDTYGTLQSRPSSVPPSSHIAPGAVPRASCRSSTAIRLNSQEKDVGINPEIIPFASSAANSSFFLRYPFSTSPPPPRLYPTPCCVISNKAWLKWWLPNDFYNTPGFLLSFNLRKEDNYSYLRTTYARERVRKFAISIRMCDATCGLRTDQPVTMELNTHVTRCTENLLKERPWEGELCRDAETNQDRWDFCSCLRPDTARLPPYILGVSHLYVVTHTPK
jgi:hypothetical protein